MSDKYELSLLHRSIQQGRWGFALALPDNTSLQTPFKSDALLAVDVDSFMARTWCITLCSWRYAKGALPTNTHPPDNQVITSMIMRASVQWGVEGGQERVVMDYPAKGCCFQIQAASIRLSLFTEGGYSVGAILPNLGGYVTPYPRFAVVDMAPTFTTQLASIPSLGTFLFDIPARAVAYRYFVQTGTAKPLQFDEFDGVGGALTQIDGTSLTPGDEPAALQGNRQGYFPLNPRSQLVRVTNNDPGNVASVGLQFLLDLG